MLTPKQKMVLEAIQSYFATKGEMPTIRELHEEVKAKGSDIKSLRTLFMHLAALLEAGYLRKVAGKRGLELTENTDDSFLDIPVFGAANAGSPTLLAEQNVQGYLKFSRRFLNSDKVFAIKVHGDSMNEAIIHDKKINDGDYVIVDPEAVIRNGDKVLVAIDGVATIKEYRLVEHGVIGLFPISNNKYHQPIYLTEDDHFIVNGKVIGIMRGINN